MRFPADEWEFEAVASMSLLVLFSSVRKAHIFSLKKEKRVLFLYGQEKNEKKPQAYRLTVSASRKCIPSAPDTCLRTTGGTQSTAEHAERAASVIR